MNDKMKKRIIENLSLKTNLKLYCIHNKDNVCKECGDKISGNVSRIYGDVSKISGNVSRIYGSLEM